MSAFAVRALEIHSQYAWDYEWVARALRFMQQRGLNTLVLHRNDLVDLVVYPGQYFGAKREHYASIFERYQDIYQQLYRYTPTRRSGPYQRRAYLKRVLEMASRAGVQVWIENKELYFPEILLEFHPELVKDGHICACEPFWWEFTEVKYREFFEEFPEVAGIIVAPATGESKVSISSNRCTCALCRGTTKQDWFKRLAHAMHKPISAAGRQLVIRDFVFDAKTHAEIAAAMEQLPADIAFSLKNTPHDFYPTFPDNPRIGAVPGHQQWVEYDAMGQYYGWGIGVSAMEDDYRRRLAHAQERGVSGVVIRTDWESLDGHSAFQTLNAFNLYAFSALANDLQADGQRMARDWLQDRGWLAPAPDADGAVAWVHALLQPTWDVVRRTCYVNDCVFSDSSQLPVSVEHAFWLAEKKNSLKDWIAEKANALDTGEANLRQLLAEKDEALARVRVLQAQAAAGHPGLTADARRELCEAFDAFERYVQAFRVVAQAVLLARRRSVHGPQGEFDAVLRERMEDLLRLAGEFRAYAQETDLNHRIYTLLDPDRLLALHGDLVRQGQAGDKA
ncbi:hypothetical protein HHL11_14230 [Ramlibacter sp. G-1-2-2]|uniref:Uncharacterized protein n=1 Tax=Ramlibacter agri TaxID=2728837 RepID=A0A848H531_9BURK|nr:hypothetical protein [Ramlibacter agri]NML44912.1 hypothetical protein [Ramlibacter agri]